MTIDAVVEGKVAVKANEPATPALHAALGDAADP